MSQIKANSQSNGNAPHIFVVGNEKGGAGKTTCSMHLVVGLLDRGYRVATIDVDSRQHSLTSYINNRKEYNDNNPDRMVDVSYHIHLEEVNGDSIEKKNKSEKHIFDESLNLAKENADYIVIDTPGSHTNFSKIAHSYADTVITPINDSFVDLDVMAKIDKETFDSSKPSIYSQMLWEQKMERASRDQGSIEWVVVRNRLNTLDAQNKRNINFALKKLSKRIAFRVVPGFSERVIFRELFPYGLTLLDLKKANFTKSFSLSHVAARQEIRNFMDSLGISQSVS
ncbi:division plane positioning ATPase MipZ [Rickettsiaceae bacterium]|nr:division plane positioning ATPase MipZ [Rickettsiaceae bacterium]